ncbi:MAG: excinuclease ABC subunit UvrA, partial [Bacteroidota bacterium]
RPSSFVLRPSSLVLRPSSLVPHPSITLKGVSTHNLRQIELDIPHNRITVITGVSGSGKSSLAFDTIHAEAQNRFMEGFSTYIRSRVGMKEKPDFESITGLTPTLALGQSSGNLNPRSTVGTITGIYDLYRLLYSRLSSPLTFPQYIKTDESSPLPFWGGVGGGVISTLFSFNHQHGACHDCKGLGEQTRCDVSKLITHPNHSILDGAMDGTKTGKFYGDPYGQYTAYIRAVGTSRGIDFSKPWRELANAEKELAMGGSGDELYEVTWEFKRNNRTGEHRFTGKWQGLLTLVETEYLRKHADHRAAGMMNVMSALPCLSCNGARLNAEALNYKLAGFNIANLTDLVVEDAIEFFASFHTQTATKSMMAVAEPMVTEINRKLKALSNLGLSYLAVSRPFATLSAGEARRVKLASQIGSGLTGITYILDEPTAGLHPDDTVNLMNHIRSLCETGNTVIIVEHDREVILAADHIIDLGPGAGINGGRIVSTGAPEMIMQNQESLTGRYLRKAEIVVPSANRQLSSGLQITGAVMHNLKGFDLDIPAGGIIVVTGVSGSGKSSLVFDLIYASAMQGKAVGCSVIKGFDNFSRIVAAEHKKDFTAANSIVATYTGLLDFIRDLFAQEKLAISAGITRNHFSFLNKAGQCPYCEGRGFSRTSMDFLPDVVVTCERCNGSRYADNVLEILYRKKNIAGVLGLTVGEAIDFFHGNHRIGEILQLLSKIGLDYLTLGQSLATLSGGEGQRMYLATEMIKPAKGASLYLFDEPSAGLHFYDIAQLLTTFKGLVDKGHSLLIIEHDPLVIAHADYVIELGAGGGEKGGYLIKKTASLF